MSILDPCTYRHFLTSPQIPPELVLKTIQYLPFGDGETVSTLRYTHPRLWNLFKTYERSITGSFMKKELRHALTDFPPRNDDSVGLKWLGECVRKYDLADDVMDALVSERNCYRVQRWNISLVNAGLLLLYQLAEMDTHTARLTHIKQLSHDPLTAIYLTLHHSTLSARYHGSGWIHQRTYGRFMDTNQLTLRNELEFCFSEAALNHGPEFISDMLLHHDTSNAETTLLNVYHDHGTLDWDWPCWGTAKGEFEPPRTQGPQRGVGQRGRSLFTTLLETLAGRVGCLLKEVRSRVEMHTDDKQHSLAYLDLEGKARLLRGLDVDDGSHSSGKTIE
ncbi:hypothetical protein T440DRAFT_383796 [Plenodomus tracheiphilus IPT5]|uniref:Uncharacterized protein n=1 Tax=Plenodomus tracheiphilus IPT5 TaxID=1408161 RepID=A0A6A7BMB8_9PLEO|nr:hypothetical protein T440DRAFT_383796 [Plenodomus tracheiphilus IPT5]